MQNTKCTAQMTYVDHKSENLIISCVVFENYLMWNFFISL